MKHTEAKQLEISCSAFSEHTLIPEKYTCDGENINPPLRLGEIPPETKSLALIVDDPDAPSGTWVHWLVWNIPVTDEIKENTVPGIEGMNSFKEHGYGGPCPPSGTHRYFFKLYALDTMLALDVNSTRSDVELAMKDHILAFGQLIGLYSKKDNYSN